MKATIASIQIGRVIRAGDPNSRRITDRQWTTGFYKNAVTGPVELTTAGIVGDSVADMTNHGGPSKALLCYAAKHYEAWRAEHPDLSMSAGGLGENLTIDGADETTVCIGDRYRVGDCEVSISQPRQPCWKIARRWGVKTLTKEVAQSGRTGWYLCVTQPGQLDAGMELELLGRPQPDWPISRLNDILFGREVDRLAVMQVMALAELSESWKSALA